MCCYKVLYPPWISPIFILLYYVCNVLLAFSNNVYIGLFNVSHEKCFLFYVQVFYSKENIQTWFRLSVHNSKIDTRITLQIIIISLMACWKSQLQIKDLEFWRHVQWSDETLLSHQTLMCVCREEENCRHTSARRYQPLCKTQIDSDLCFLLLTKLLTALFKNKIRRPINSPPHT